LKREFEFIERRVSSLRRRIIFSIIIAIPLLLATAFSFIPRLLGLTFHIDPVIQAVMATTVQIYGGYEFYKNACRAIRYRVVTMDVLVAISTTVACLYSLYGVILYSMGVPHEFFFEAAVSLIAFVSLGRYIEVLAKKNVLSSVKRLVELQPDKAYVLRDGEIREIPIQSIKINDKVVVRPGNRIPVDGIVLEGKGFIDESLLTGESTPIPKKVGDRVLGGSILLSGSLIINATRVGNDTFLAQILRTLRQAQMIKMPIQRIIDRIVAVFTPMVTLIAIATFLYWLFIAKASLDFAILTFVAVFAVACPCALGIATPLAISVGVNIAADNGVLVRNGEALEVIPTCDTVIFDKTGTLTEGKIRVTKIIPINRFSEEEIAPLIASVEMRSNHPIARSIVDYVSKKYELNLEDIEVKDFDEFLGMGVLAYVNGKRIAVGNEKFMAKLGVNIGDVEERADIIRREAKTVLFVAVDSSLAGLIVLEDTLKPEASSVINYLLRRGYNVVMLSGDNRKTVEAIARRLNIEKFYSDMLPHQKLNIIKRLRFEGRRVIMVGDGINDAPSLKLADVGIAINISSDISAEAGDILIKGSDLTKIVFIHELAVRVKRKIKENIFWAFIYNTTLIPLAAGALLPILGVFLSPVYAAIAMTLSSVSVVTNALSLKLWKFKWKSK